MIGNYALKGGEQFNMVLLVPDDIAEDGATTIERNVDERRGIYTNTGTQGTLPGHPFPSSLIILLTLTKA